MRGASAFRARRKLAQLVAAVLLFAASPACRRHAEGVVARLLDAHGVVERTDAAAWHAVEPGFGFVLGDAVRTGGNSGARLQMGGASTIRMDSNSRLRFVRGALARQAGPEVGVELGSAEIEQTGPELPVFLTRAGLTRLEHGARVRLRADGDASSLEVLVGRAIIMRPDGEVAIEEGQGLRIRIGSAVVERYQMRIGPAIVEPAVEPAAEPAAPQTTETPTPEHPAETPPSKSPSRSADVTFSGGESGIVHDSRPWLNVRLRFDRLCADEGTVEIAGTRGRPERLTGRGTVIFKLRAGTQRYRVRCAGDPRDAAPRATGALSFKHDNGSAPLPPRPPSNTIEADGRLYTVLFQTRPPRLTLVWPDAPPGTTDLELHIESATGARTIRAAKPRHEVPSGVLPEGKSVWWYAARGGRVSPKTTVTIRFDNAAPAAQFFRAKSGAAPSGAIAVDGVAMEDAKVTAAGKPVPVDDHGRFHAAVIPLEGDAAVAVRLEPPRGGVHYYIRRPPSER